jgi:16S rRNA (cytidine1402-2'-O)-methyltransferase
MAGTLYLVSTPIGNVDDITARALRTLRDADVIVCEERKEGARLLRYYEMPHKQLEELNEHTVETETESILDLLKAGKSVAIISDCGTPVFSDPGQQLVERARAIGIKIVPVPGASSLMPALIVSGFSLKRFYFYGFLSPKHDQRIAELWKLKNEPNTFVLMDTPYRLTALLTDLKNVLGAHRRICVAYDLTMPTEDIFHGTAEELSAKFSAAPKKGEFVIVVEGAGSR